MIKKFLTLQELKDINKKLDYLKKTEKAKVINEITEARLLGDLSENPEYQLAKKKKTELDLKIRELESMISNCSVVKEVDKSISFIKLRNIKNNKIITYDSKNYKDINDISILKIFKNKNINDIIKLKKYNKEILFEILEIY